MNVRAIHTRAGQGTQLPPVPMADHRRAPVFSLTPALPMNRPPAQLLPTDLSPSPLLGGGENDGVMGAPEPERDSVSRSFVVVPAAAGHRPALRGRFMGRENVSQRGSGAERLGATRRLLGASLPVNLVGPTCWSASPSRNGATRPRSSAVLPGAGTQIASLGGSWHPSQRERARVRGAGRSVTHRSSLRIGFGCAPEQDSRAVTLLELLISVSLLMIIVLGLYQMFNKTQQVMRSGVTSTEVQESGRIALDMIRRELEQLTPAATTLSPNPQVTNLFVSDYFSTSGTALTMALGTGQVQSNLLQDFFFLVFDPSKDATPFNWSGRGYRVADPGNPLLRSSNGVGTLFRYVTNANRFSPAFLANYLSGSASLTDFQRVADNVIHLSLRAVSNGVPVNAASYVFSDTNAPSFLELEIGFMEATAVDQSRARLGASAQRVFLETQVNRVHYFKTVIPVRTSIQ